MSKVKFLKLFSRLANLRSKFLDRRSSTLAELLVAIAVFSVIVSIAVGGFISGLRTNRQALSLIAAVSNSASVLEQIARDLRTGYNFPLPSGPVTSISFSNAELLNTTYEKQGSSVVRQQDPSATFEKMTDDNVIVDYLYFTVLSYTNYPSRIVINLGIKAKEAGVDSATINIQTTVSARNPGA